MAPGSFRSDDSTEPLGLPSGFLLPSAAHHHHQTTMQRLHLLQFALGFVLGLSAAAAIVSAAATPSPVVTPAAQRSWPTEFPGP